MYTIALRQSEDVCTVTNVADMLMSGSCTLQRYASRKQCTVTKGIGNTDVNQPFLSVRDKWKGIKTETIQA